MFVLGWSAWLPGSSCKQPLGLGRSQDRKGACAEQVEELGQPGQGAGIRRHHTLSAETGGCLAGGGPRPGERAGRGFAARGGVGEDTPVPTNCLTLDPPVYFAKPQFPHHQNGDNNHAYGTGCSEPQMRNRNEKALCTEGSGPGSEAESLKKGRAKAREEPALPWPSPESRSPKPHTPYPCHPPPPSWLG